MREIASSCVVSWSCLGVGLVVLLVVRLYVFVTSLGRPSSPAEAKRPGRPLVGTTRLLGFYNFRDPIPSRSISRVVVSERGEASAGDKQPLTGLQPCPHVSHCPAERASAEFVIVRTLHSLHLPSDTNSIATEALGSPQWPTALRTVLRIAVR